MADGELSKNDPAVARRGLVLLFQKGVVEAEALLQQHRGKNAQVDCSLGYIMVLRSLMTWEEDAVSAASDYLKDVEKRCSASGKEMPHIKNPKARQHFLLLQVVEADCMLLRALLYFTKMAIPAYVRGGMLLRSASKQYTRVYAEIESMDREASVQSNGSDDKAVPASDTARAACSFGFGAFNLIMSLLPEKVLSVMKLLGFHGDRKVGLETLQFASRSNDMRSPMALLAILWYHAIGRAVLGIGISGGYEDAIACSQAVLKESEVEFATAPLFNYFRGRTAYLQCDPSAAMEAFTLAADSCGGQREVQHICFYEMGFINVLNFNFEKAAPLFARLSRETRWSSGYYAYLSAMCLASGGQIAEAKELLARLPSLVLRKNSNYEKFVLRKTSRLKKMQLTEDIAQVLLFEVVFMWSYLDFSTQAQRDAVRQLMEEKQPGVSDDVTLLTTNWLVQGALYFLLDQSDEAEVRLRDVLNMADKCVKTKDSQIPAFATLYLGIIYKQRGQLDKAKSALEKAKSSFSDYEVESRVHTKVKAALEEVAHLQKPK